MYAFGGEGYYVKAEILNRYTHGFNYDKTPYSAWSLIENNSPDCNPAEFIIYREFGKRRPLVVNKNKIISCEEESNEQKRVF